MERPLTKREQAMIDYHRSMLNSGKYLTQPDGELTTFMGTRFGVDNKPYPYGQIGYAPTYMNGKVMNLDDPNEREQWMNNVRKLPYPTYKTDIEADMAEERMHNIMEADVRRYKEAKRPPLSKLMGIKK
jgi:hypothetical protein